MKKAAKNKSNIYAYLNSTNVLENGSEQDIALAKKQYWKAYKAEWKKRQRQATREFTIVCHPKDAEVIIQAAKRHRRSLQAFIKAACLAYIGKQYITPDVVAINAIRQQLAMNYNVLQNMFDENIVPYQAGSTVLQLVSELEKTVFDQLQNPKTLEELIADTVRSRPEYKTSLIELLQNL